jgi:hypothetical protein
MGIRPYFADAVASFENYGPDETGDMGNEDSKNSGSDVTEDMESEDESTDRSYSGYVTEEDMENEDESTVHHIAVVDDVEVCHNGYSLCH